MFNNKCHYSDSIFWTFHGQSHIRKTLLCPTDIAFTNTLKPATLIGIPVHQYTSWFVKLSNYVAGPQCKISCWDFQAQHFLEIKQHGSKNKTQPVSSSSVGWNNTFKLMWSIQILQISVSIYTTLYNGSEQKSITEFTACWTLRHMCRRPELFFFSFSFLSDKT